jgi:galactokinase/mevalonate kinase-like predicted kinase
MLSSTPKRCDLPQSVLRSDEIVWGRAPARFDTGGGWTDTPPYSLEYGGSVVGTAVDLNGQPPIQAYARVIDEPVIRIASIDLGTRIEVSSLDELIDYRDATSEYGLVKGALALSGFSRQVCDWSDGTSLEEMLLKFGGGIELTTLAAIPKGSGLGTSSIMGAVIIAVIERVMGSTLEGRELFNRVLQLEQSLTTGGGWQDQIGGAVGGVKIISAQAGLVCDARIHFLPPDLIDPARNDGQTLLYYTGITRLAKNILEQVVGRVLNRDRAAMATLGQIYSLAGQIAEAISRKDIAGFGGLIDSAWRLNKQLDPNSTNDAVEDLMARVEPFVYGAKLLGAGGGGFLLMVCKSCEDAKRIRTMLDNEPPNARARFFDYSVNPQGLVVTVS